jgi:hypothetical protein
MTSINNTQAPSSQHPQSTPPAEGGGKDGSTGDAGAGIAKIFLDQFKIVNQKLDDMAQGTGTEGC